MADLVRDPPWPGDRGNVAMLDDELWRRVSWARRRALDEVGIYIIVASGWRSEAEQIVLRRQNCGTSAYDIWRKPSSLCIPPTAIPGSSNHEKTPGRAVDLSPGPRSIPKVRAIFYEAGLTDPVAREDWHWELAPNRQPLPDTPPPPPPQPEDDMPLPNDYLIRHRDGREVLVNGVTREGSLVPGTHPDRKDPGLAAGIVGWYKQLYAFSNQVNPASPDLEDRRSDTNNGTALIDFGVVHIHSS